MELNKLNAKILSKFGQAGAIFGVTLMEAIKLYPEITVLSSDMSTPAGLDKFKRTFPAHFINVGIAEQEMIGMASGLVSEGIPTIAVAQACFISMRSFEQLRQYGGYMRFPFIAIGISSGFALTYMGNTHYAIEDIALARTIPGMTIISPSDASQAGKAFLEALKAKTPVYIRLTGGLNSPIIYEEEYNYEIGRAIRLKEGNDVQIIATGTLVSAALQAAILLEEEGVFTEVVDMHTIKPLDTTVLTNKHKLIVTIEEHSIIGGLGGAIAEYIAENSINGRLLRIGIKDTFSHVGDHQYLLEQHGLTANEIKKSIINQL